MGKYERMAPFLEAQKGSRIRLDFARIEDLLGFSLPRSASDHQAWWANDPNHSQAKGWLAAGWRTENLNLSGRTVEFVREGGASPPKGPSDPWGALAGTVTIHDPDALTKPTGEVWDAEL